MSSMYGSMGKSGPTGSTSGLKGTGYKQATMQKFTPEQMNLFQQMFSQVSPESFTSKLAGGDQSQFDQLQAPALRQFEDLQGSIANRFSGQGMGGRHSSGFYNSQNTAASNFAQDLQSQRMGIQRQALQDLMGLSTSLLGQNPYENVLLQKQQKDPGFWKSLIANLAGGAGSAAGSLGSMYGTKQLGLF